MADLVTQYQQSLQALLPHGRAWTGDMLRALCDALAVEFSRADEQFTKLHRIEMDPTQTYEMLDAWETALGLPETCLADVVQTVDERRNAIVARLREVGGQCPQFYLDIADALGLRGAQIIEYRPFRMGSRMGDALNGIQRFRMGSRMGDRLQSADWAFTWDLRSDLDDVVLFRMGSRMGDRLQSFGDITIACLLDKLKPAHTHARATFA